MSKGGIFIESGDKLLSIEFLPNNEGLVCVSEGKRMIGRIRGIGGTTTAGLSASAITELILGTNNDNELEIDVQDTTSSPSPSSSSGVFATSRQPLLRIVQVEDGPLGIELASPIQRQKYKDEAHGLLVLSSSHTFIRAGEVIASCNGVRLIGDSNVTYDQAIHVLRSSRYRRLVLLRPGPHVEEVVDVESDHDRNALEDEGSVENENNEGNCCEEWESDSEKADPDIQAGQALHLQWKGVKKRYVEMGSRAMDRAVTRCTGTSGIQNLHTLTGNRPMGKRTIFRAAKPDTVGSSNIYGVAGRLRKRNYERELHEYGGGMNT